MGEDPEEFTIPSETQGLEALRWVALLVFISVSAVIFGAVFLSLIMR